MLVNKWSCLLAFLLLKFCVAWIDERPTFESINGNLYISSAKDKNITLKTLGSGNININDINLLNAVWAAQNASHLVERWKSGILDDVESTLQRLSHIIEGPNGLLRKINVIEYSSDSPLNTSNIIKTTPETESGVSTLTVAKVRSLSSRLRRLEIKVRTINVLLRTNECASDPCHNGGTCIDNYDSFHCQCPPEWQGTLCLSDVNECDRYKGTPSGCQNGATCINLPGSFSCTCPPGWHGFHCATQKSVCDESSNSELCGHGVCVKTNTPLGYTCICEAGWDHLGDTDPSCRKDVDECTGSRYPCSVNPLVTCHNVPGTFYCGSCPAGYTGDGFKCQDIDECLVNNGGCSTAPMVECINSMGSRKCGMCPSGYQGDGVTCFYIGSCTSNNGGCHRLASCREGPNSEVLCLCPAGYEGSGKGPQGCKVAENACSSSPCAHGSCESQGPSGFVCTCSPGYTGERCDRGSNPCEPNPCKNNGTCSQSNGRPVCECTGSYTGPTCTRPKQSCGGYFINPSGRIEFPASGNKYDHGLSCAWVIITNHSMVLNVTFTKFSLESAHGGDECKHDYVQVHDGRSAGSHIIGRYCGNELPNNGTFVSTHNALYIWFRSDKSVSGDGFAFSWASVEPTCGGEIEAEYGSISSPGYPGKYPTSRDCYWNVRAQPGKRIAFHFINLAIEEHPTCDFDYIEINETNYIGEHRIGIFCNHSQPAPLTTSGSNAIVHFHSDNSGTDNGFHLSFLTMPGSPDCGGIYTAERGEIVSPGYSSGNYKSDTNCDWEIRLPEGSHVRINWLNFDVERSRNCMFDSVQIYEGPTTDSPLVGRYCGSALPPPLSVKSNRVLVRFETDANLEEKGFTIKYEVECGGIFTDPSGILKSPFYPNFYPGSKECVYLISQPPGKAVVLTFEFMDIEEGSVFNNQSECYFDRLEIRDGDTENSTLIKSVCGSMHSMPTDPLYSTHNFMYIKFFTDASIHNHGFKANYTTIDRDCGGIIKKGPGTINLPGATNRWNSNLNCLWTIRAPPNHAIQLTWTSFPSITSTMSDECTRNYVELVEDYGSTDAKSLGKYCPNKTPPQIMTTQGNDLTLNYHLTSDYGDTTYQASYVFVNDTHNCGGHYFTPTGYIRSPNYPEKYPKNKECIWVIEAESKYLVTLTFNNFNLESSSKCMYDYLEIRSGSRENSPLLGRFCGDQVENEITSMTNQIYVKFVSDASLQKKGFEIQWNSIKTGCGGNLHTSNGAIISPNYPLNYYHRAACTWNIRVSAGSVIQITFTDFELEDHIKCAFDYLEISDLLNGYSLNTYRFCGTKSPPLLISDTNQVKLYFRSDVLTNSRGFHLRYTTDCNNKLYGFQGVIESPNFPQNYENLSNCTWIISVPSGNTVNITFSHFNVQSSPDGSCKRDYVKIQEGEDDQPNREIMTKCGQEEDVLPLRISSTQRQVFISFVSDRFTTAGGFRLEWYISGCSKYLTKPYGSFESPGYPNGNKLPSAYVECRWLIEVDFDKSIEVTFPKIENTRSRACNSLDNNGSIEIYNGLGETSPQLAHGLCYSDTPVTYTSTGSRMYIKYASETNYASHGFTAVYKSVAIQCGGKFTGQSGVIHSANYPRNYPHNQMCDWLITVDQNHAVNLTFIDLDLEKSRNCSDDYLKIYDGNSTEAPLMGTHCRSSEILPFYVSSANQILVRMRTDALVSAKGFLAHYNRTCGARITVDGYGVLRSSPTLHTMSALNCSWIISAADPSDKVTLTFSHIDLESQDCLSNHIEIYEGEGIEGPMLGQICNNKIPKPFYSTGNTLTVHMTTVYGHTVGDKFDAIYSSFSNACGGKYTAEKGVIASPNHPSSYPNNADCIWTIQNSPGNRITLTFENFELLESENCDVDYLEIRENDGIGKLRGVFCGKNIESITSSEPLWIRFKSSSNTVGNPNGFMAEYSLLFGNELTGDTGELASPMYPVPCRKPESFSWRVTVEFNFVIKLEFLDFHFDHYEEYCYSSLKIYDGFDDEAPLIKDLCGISVPSDTITSSSNIIFIEMENNFDHVGNWFHLKWLKIPRSSNTGELDDVIKSNSSALIILNEKNGTYTLESPGFPNGYEDNLRAYWTIVSPIGTHLILRFITLDVEETENCVADYVAIYKGFEKAIDSEENLLHKVCLSNSTSTNYAGTNVMTVEFSSDSYNNKTGFSAIVLTECGGIFEESSGTIQLNSSLTYSRPRPFIYSCEWLVKVRSGRKMKVNVVENRIETNQPKTTDNSCRSNYLMLKNGDSPNSPLLGIGKYCNGVKPPVLNTTSNYLYVKLAISFATVNFKLTFRELGHDCGGRFELSSKNDNQQEITSPNYPNIPTPHTECTWTFMGVDAHRLSIHFIDRFDLSVSEDCEKEYVEIRDGGTDNSPLLGRYCKNTPPSSLSTKGNVLFVRYFTDLAEPRNGFKAIVTTGDVCGGIERKHDGGVITSPNYPDPYNTKSQQCSWWIIGPMFNRGIKIQFEDFMLPSAPNCSDTDHVTIYEKLPGSFNNTEIGTYCGGRKPGAIEILTSEAVILFQSNFGKHISGYGRGFKLNYTFNNDGCGGNLEGLSGEIKTNGYPRPTAYKYCNWKITVPIGLRVVVDIEDLDIGNSRYAMGSHVSFHHDLGSLATIAILKDSSQSRRIESSANYMSIYYISTGGHRGMKARFTAVAPSACGGIINTLNGTLTSPRLAPFNETSYFCKWTLTPPDELQGTSVQVENEVPMQTLVMTISGTVSNGRATVNCQYYLNYIMIKGDEILAKVCGNITKESLVVTSPYRSISIEAVNATRQQVKVNFNINYKWHKCGGILTGPTHTIKPPENITYPVHCTWKVKYPDTDDTILVSFDKMNLGPCDKSYINIKGKTYRSPSLGKFCGNIKPQNIVSPTNEITIDYYAEESSQDFEINLNLGEYACGGIVRGKRTEIRSPGFPKSYTNNTECIWEIVANNGYHVGLTFVERFNLETSKDCQNDYVEVYEWVESVRNLSDPSAHWKSLGRNCGRVAPQDAFNSTNNKMMVKFVSNDKIEGEGFKAIWHSNCGGVYEVTRDVKYIESPNFQGGYPSNIVCNYTLIAPEDEHIVVDFTNFFIEGTGMSCIYDNLTINSYHSGIYLRDSSTWCGSNSPGKKMSTGKMEIIFKTDNSVNRDGFKFKYFMNDCGGNVTTPRKIKLETDPTDSYIYFNCIWVITAPPKKSVLLRFEKFNITQTSRDCTSSALHVYEGNNTQHGDQQKNKLKATFCGDLNQNLPVIQSLGNAVTLTLFLHGYAVQDQALEVVVLFANGPEEGCGGNVTVSAAKRTEFKTQLTEFYEPFQDCQWTVNAHPGYTIEFTIDELDLRNTTFNNSIVNQHNSCNSDYIEIRDGGPYSELIGRFCGPWNPSPIRSTGNLLFIRFVTDGTNEGRGIKGSFKAITSPCGITDLELDNTTKTLTTPNYPNGYASDITCRWVIHGSSEDSVRLTFEDFSLTDSEKCDTEYLQIADLNNREIIREGFGEQMIIGTSGKRNRIFEVNYMPHTFYRYCGSKIPHDYYSNFKDVEIIFKGSSRGIVDNKGFKLKYGKASCSHNYTALQGRILHKDISDCWVTIDVPQNYTISMYFNQFFLPGKYDCSLSSMQIWDGGFYNNSIQTVCNYQIPNPVFSTGNRLSFHSFSSREGYYTNSYDITYTSTANGRGCGGQFYNYGGVFTSPLYPNPYRNRSQCMWDVRVPKGMKVQLQFSVFDIGPKSMCDTDYLTITEVRTNGQEDLIMTYCGSDVPADYESESDRVLVTYTTSINNGGSGWIIKFLAFQ